MINSKVISLVVIIQLLFTQQSFAQFPSKFIHVDQFGYLTNAEKVAVISNPEVGYNANDSYSIGNILQVINANSNNIVYSAAPDIWDNGNIHELSGDSGWWFNFSSVIEQGTYYILDPSTNERSAEFEINDNPYSQVLQASFKTFYYNRCNDSKEEPYAGSKWTDTNNFPQDFATRDAFDQDNPARERDMAGGWFDAGDYNKYVTFAHNPIHHLLTTYEENPDLYTDSWNIPESGDNVPDILNEVKWELDWLRKMINADGTVHIKMGSLDYILNDFAPPSNNFDGRFYAPVCSSASIAVASTFAHAAKVFRTIPALNNYAQFLEDDAILCWDRFITNFNNNDLQTDCDDQTVKAGDADLSELTQLNMAVIAAVYLYEITGNNTYSNFVHDNLTSTEPFINGAWNTNQTVLLETLLYYNTLPNRPQSFSNSLLNSIEQAINNNNSFQFSNTDLYRVPVPEWFYYWGSNMTLCNLGLLSQTMVKYNVVPSANESLLRKANEIIHYMHGVNPQGIVYLSNMYDYGADYSVNEITHTWFIEGTIWDNALESASGPAPGYLAGGPNQSYTGELSPPANQPVQKCYLDFNDIFNEPSYEVTEPAIYYQSAYTQLLANYVNQTVIVTANNIINTENDISISPNPTTNFCKVNGDLKGSTIQVISLEGKLYRTLKATDNNITIDISDLPEGMFFIKLENGSSTILKKVLKLD